MPYRQQLFIYGQAIHRQMYRLALHLQPCVIGGKFATDLEAYLLTLKYNTYDQ
jgi:hypothetical protein